MFKYEIPFDYDRNQIIVWIFIQLCVQIAHDDMLNLVYLPGMTMEENRGKKTLKTW